jgi:predicted nuclease with TOPRIM domain
LRKGNTELHKENDELKHRVIELEELADRLNGEVEKQNQRREELEQDIAQLQKRNKNLAEDIHSLAIDLKVVQDLKEREFLAQVCQDYCSKALILLFRKRTDLNWSARNLMRL